MMSDLVPRSSQVAIRKAYGSPSARAIASGVFTEKNSLFLIVGLTSIKSMSRIAPRRRPSFDLAIQRPLPVRSACGKSRRIRIPTRPDQETPAACGLHGSFADRAGGRPESCSNRSHRLRNELPATVPTEPQHAANWTQKDATGGLNGK